jgi:hypothetical protein
MDLIACVGNQVIGVKVEEVTDIKEEDDLEQFKSPVIKTEAEVSCMCVSPALGTFCRYLELPVFLPVCPCETGGHWSVDFEQCF